MKKLGFVGIAGAVFLVFGVITNFLLTEDVYYIARGHLAAGALLLVVFAIGGGLKLVHSSALKRAAGFGFGVTLYTTLFLALLVAVNYAVTRHVTLRFDSTEQKVYTLAPQTQQVLDSLERPILVRAFYMGGKIDPKVEDLLKLMAERSAKLHWKAVDPEKQPQLVSKLGIKEQGSLHFSFENESEKAEKVDTKGPLSRVARIAGQIGEQEVVNGILKLTRGGTKILYYTQGHGERDLNEVSEAGFNVLKEAIEAENITLLPLTLRAGEGIPKDASGLLVMSPQRSFLPFEREAISGYLKNGGSALLFAEPHTSDEVSQLAKPFGIEVGNDVVVDEFLGDSSGPGLGVQPVVSTFGEHPVTDNFRRDIVLSTVSSVRAVKPKAEGDEPPPPSNVTELAFTGDKSWAETNLDLLFAENSRAEIDPEDIKGPVSIAAAYEAPASDGKSNTRILVIGDSDFVANINIRLLFNEDFALNALNWVLGDNEGMTIRARTLRQSLRGLTAAQVGTMFLFGAIVLPELILLSGLGVWWSRKG